MMEDLITDLRNMTGMGRFARAEVREILGYLESVGWLSEPKKKWTPPAPAHEWREDPVIEAPEQIAAVVADRPLFPAVDNLVEVAQSDV